MFSPGLVALKLSLFSEIHVKHFFLQSFVNDSQQEDEKLFNSSLHTEPPLPLAGLPVVRPRSRALCVRPWKRVSALTLLNGP